MSFAASGNCTVSGSTVHLTSAGSCTITASQAGNANYNAAADVPQSFTINQGSAGTPLSITSSVEGTLSFSSGAWVNGGWHVKLSTANASPVTVTLTGNVNLPVSCPSGGGSGGTITVPVSKTVTIPAGSTSYMPTNDQKSALGWMGAVQAPALCGANAMRNTAATLERDRAVVGAHGSAHLPVPLPRARRSEEGEHELQRFRRQHRLPGEVELDRDDLISA